jgi:hypothetical protein
MSTIWRYSLRIRDAQVVDIPAGGKVLSVAHRQDTDHDIDMWVLVDDGPPAAEARMFRVFGTGQPVEADSELVHLGTCQVQGGAVVFHVFEELQP